MKKYLAIGAVILLAIIVIPEVRSSMAKSKLKNEINRVAGISGIQPTFINCGDIELALVCTAQYPAMDAATEKQMLTASGYTLLDTSTAGDRISATNTSKATRVDSEPANIAVLKLKFKDINVTL